MLSKNENLKVTKEKGYYLTLNIKAHLIEHLLTTALLCVVCIYVECVFVCEYLWVCVYLSIGTKIRSSMLYMYWFSGQYRKIPTITKIHWKGKSRKRALREWYWLENPLFPFILLLLLRKTLMRTQTMFLYCFIFFKVYLLF